MTIHPMKRPGFAIVLALLCGNAAAEWTLVGGHQTIFRAYADAQSVRRSGDSAQMWGLYDFQMPDLSPDGQPQQSTVVLREFDCRDARVRLLAFVDYAGHMGTGKVISAPGASSGAPSVVRWEPIVAGALDEAFWKIACGKP